MNAIIIGLIFLMILGVTTVVMVIIEHHDKVKAERFHNRCKFMMNHPKCRYNAKGKIYIKD